MTPKIFRYDDSKKELREKKPEMPIEAKGAGYVHDLDYARSLHLYNEHIASLLTYPAQGFDKSFEGMDLVEGVDFVLDCKQREDVCIESKCKSMAECKYGETIATPLAIPASTEQGEGKEDEAFEKFISSLQDAKDKFKDMNPDQLRDMVGILMQISAAYMMPLFYSLSCENGIEAAFVNDDNGDKFLLSFRKDGREIGSILNTATTPSVSKSVEALIEKYNREKESEEQKYRDASEADREGFAGDQYALLHMVYSMVITDLAQLKSSVSSPLPSPPIK